MNHRIDQTDVEILRILQQNSSLSHKQIGRKLNKSITTICNRIKWLVKNGYISTYKAILNRNKLNLDIFGCLYLRLGGSATEAIDSITQFLMDKNCVSECWDITGEYNIKMEIFTKDTDSFHRIVTSIVALKNIKEYYSYIHLKELIANRGLSI